MRTERLPSGEGHKQGRKEFGDVLCFDCARLHTPFAETLIVNFACEASNDVGKPCRKRFKRACNTTAEHWVALKYAFDQGWGINTFSNQVLCTEHTEFLPPDMTKPPEALSFSLPSPDEARAAQAEALESAFTRSYMKIRDHLLKGQYSIELCGDQVNPVVVKRIIGSCESAGWQHRETQPLDLHLDSYVIFSRSLSKNESGVLTFLPANLDQDWFNRAGEEEDDTEKTSLE